MSFVFFVLSIQRRRLLHVNVTAHPYAAWVAQQIVEAIGLDADILRLIRDRDGIYGAAFDARVDKLGIEQVKIAPRSPWQNGFAERWVGTLRRELLDLWSYWANGICCVSCGPTLRTTTKTDRICRSTATRRSHASWSHQIPAASSRFPGSAVCIAGTRGLRDRCDESFTRTGVNPAPGRAGRPRGKARAIGPKGRVSQGEPFEPCRYTGMRANLAARAPRCDAPASRRRRADVPAARVDSTGNANMNEL